MLLEGSARSPVKALSLPFPRRDRSALCAYSRRSGRAWGGPAACPRYNGEGDGTFTARVKVLSNWGGSYNAVVGVGGITDDGRPDLVSRDTSGKVPAQQR